MCVCLHDQSHFTDRMFSLTYQAQMIFIIEILLYLWAAQKESTEAVQKPVKKGKELRVLDAKAGQNLCE